MKAKQSEPNTPKLAEDATLWFAEQIKKTRIKLGETQAQFAKRFGVATNSISRYETGIYQASYEIILWVLMENNQLQDDVPKTVGHANEAIKQLSKTIDGLIEELSTLKAQVRKEIEEQITKMENSNWLHGMGLSGSQAEYIEANIKASYRSIPSLKEE